MSVLIFMPLGCLCCLCYLWWLQRVRPPALHRHPVVPDAARATSSVHSLGDEDQDAVFTAPACVLAPLPVGVE
jgi:hypothetical protein